MINPFSKPRTPEEWHERARLLQKRLEGLSIAELMRGDKVGDPGDHEGRGYDPNQPRVPAGNSDGGQWTNKAKGPSERINDPRVLSDATPDNHWMIGADYAAVGHHWTPRQLFRKLGLPFKTRLAFEQAVSGPLGLRTVDPITKKVLAQHQWDKDHRQYNRAVGELFMMYLDALEIRGITPGQMTPAHAEEFRKLIFQSQDPRIKGFLDKIHLLHRLRHLRTRRQE
jgi:hypothetical protein